jgi:hypothetical protein
MFGPVVKTDVVSQSVFQFSHAHVFIDGDGWHLLCHRGSGSGYEQSGNCQHVFEKCHSYKTFGLKIKMIDDVYFF